MLSRVVWKTLKPDLKFFEQFLNNFALKVFKREHKEHAKWRQKRLKVRVTP